MAPSPIRPIALCVFRHGTRILVGEGRDPATGDIFYRPLGGGIELGEHSSQTVVREIREELATDVLDLTPLGTIENIFSYDGMPGHEIVFVYDGRFADEALYRQMVIHGIEEQSLAFRAVWLDLAGYSAGDPPLYPGGLLELLAKTASGHFSLVQPPASV